MTHRHPERRPEIAVTAESVPGGWRLVVADNGPGIEPDRIETLFQPFIRGSALGSKGTGLGLAISQRIVERHAGRIRVESEPGTGSRFIVELPERPLRQ